MKVTLRKDYKFNSSEQITVNAIYKQKYLDKGFYCLSDKMNFDNKKEEDNEWMSRFGN